MANDLISTDDQKILAFAVSAGNKLDRVGLMTDPGLAASTDVADLIADLYTALVVSGTSHQKYGPEVRIALRAFEQGVKLLSLLGKIDTTLVGLLTDWDAASATTSLRYLFTQYININGFDATAEPFIDAVYSQSVSG